MVIRDMHDLVHVSTYWLSNQERTLEEPDAHMGQISSEETLKPLSAIIA